MTTKHLAQAMNAAPVIKSVQVPTPTKPITAAESRRDTLAPPQRPAPAPVEKR